jgi:hypothetical protein
MILIIAPFDNGGQGIALRNALNQYTDKTARLLTLKQSYLGYETDILYDENDRMGIRSQLTNTDFFICLEYVPTDILATLMLPTRATAKNTIINVGGTIARGRSSDYLLKWLRDGYMLTGGYTDWSILSNIGRVAHTTNILPIEKVPSLTPPLDGTIAI